MLHSSRPLFDNIVDATLTSDRQNLILAVCFRSISSSDKMDPEPFVEFWRVLSVFLNSLEQSSQSGNHVGPAATDVAHVKMAISRCEKRITPRVPPNVLKIFRLHPKCYRRCLYPFQ